MTTEAISAFRFNDVSTVAISAFKLKEASTEAISAFRFNDVSTEAISAFRFNDVSTEAISAFRFNEASTVTTSAFRFNEASTVTTSAFRFKDTSVFDLLEPIKLVIVVEKLESSPSAAANSFNVFKVEGAESTKFETVFCTNAVVAICVVVVPKIAVGALGVPVKSGEDIFAFISIALCVAVEIGLFISLVLSTLSKPIDDDVIPETDPEKIASPETIMLELNDAFFSTNNFSFIDTSQLVIN